MYFENMDILLLTRLFGCLDVLGLDCLSCLGGWICWVWVVISFRVVEYSGFYFFFYGGC